MNIVRFVSATQRACRCGSTAGTHRFTSHDHAGEGVGQKWKALGVQPDQSPTAKKSESASVSRWQLGEKQGTKLLPQAGTYPFIPRATGSPWCLPATVFQNRIAVVSVVWVVDSGVWSGLCCRLIRIVRL